jgi:DNA-binding response OmpR family regulator
MLARAEKRQPPLPPEEILQSRNVNVLVLHDDEPLRQFLDLHLTHAGYQVRVASDSVGASELVFENAPDVMVLDIDMPGVHCFEFLAEIRAEKTIPYFPVVYLTSDVMAATYACQLGAGCVHKPIQPSRLLATIAQTT